MKKNIKFLLISFLVVANVIFLVLFNNKISAHEGLGGITMSDADFTEDDIV